MGLTHCMSVKVIFLDCRFGTESVPDTCPHNACNINRSHTETASLKVKETVFD